MARMNQARAKVRKPSGDALLLEAKSRFDLREWAAALHLLEGVPESLRGIEHWNLQARCLEALGRLPEALDCVDRCLALQPDNAADLRNRGVLLSRLGRREDALASFDAVLAIRPEHVDVLIKKAHLLHHFDRREQALETIERAVQAAPADLNALNTRGMILETLCRYDESMADFDRVLQIDATFHDAINNRGMIHARFARFKEALACYDESLAIVPEQVQALYNRAMVLLAMGDWARGLKEFESRWNIAPLEAARFNRLAPVWSGKEDVTGKTVLLHHEQGYGDSLQFCRYAALVAKKGARVILAVPAGLKSLMRSLPGNPQVVSEGDPVPAHDYCCPLMSLPMAFGTTPANVPSGVPYLRADPGKVRSWGERLGARLRPRIGLVWNGRRYAPINYPRDMPLEILQPLLAVDADFFCLQTEMSKDDEDRLARLPHVARFSDELREFSDTAALIMNLDVVVTVDTAVAHLAGALGKPVWLMNRFASCWRWLQERPDSPWYPSMRIFRQRAIGDWTGVVEQVREAAVRLSDRFVRGQSTIRTEPTRSVGPSVTERLVEMCQAALADHHQGLLDAAIAGYRRILSSDPWQPDALHYLGVALAQSGKLEEALVPLTASVERAPTNAAAHTHRGNALSGLGRHEEAIDSHRRALALDANLVDAHYNLGVTLAELGRHEDALASFDRALGIDPTHAQAHNNSGNALLELGRCEQALQRYRKATRLRPALLDAWTNLAGALRRLCRYEEALTSIEQALQLRPDHPESHSGRGAILACVGRYDEALKSYQRSIELQPMLAEGLWNKAVLHLSRGEFDEGWPLYEARWKVRALGLRHRFGSTPAWLGREPLQGKTILLHAEQGYGDSIQFSRYASIVAATGARVILGVPEALRTLMQTLDGVDQVIGNGPLPPYDFHCPVLSLPLAFKTNHASIPARESYLRADPILAERWARRLRPRRKLRVGLAWAGRATHNNDLNRSIELRELASLFRLPAQFVCLQKELRTGDEGILANAGVAMRLGEEFSDFADAAALISELDLVICVDTAVAHLAGALGRPVWILLPHVADWRWLQGREDSPWYPTARLFRQTVPRDWRGVIERVGDELQSLIDGNRAMSRPDSGRGHSRAGSDANSRGERVAIDEGT